jgi:hypothetical protein
MKCRIVRRMLVDYVEGGLSPIERTDLAAHLERCAACRADAAGLERAENALRTLGIIEPAPESVVVPRIHPAPRAGGQTRWVWAGVGVAAAAVVLAILVWPHAAQREPFRSPSANIATKTAPIEPSAPPEASEAAPPELPPAEAVATKERPVKPAPRSHAPRRIVQRSTPAPSAAPEPPTPETIPLEPPLPASVATAQESEAPAGLILLIGEPRESPPSSSYYVEISFPDGERSVVERTVERDADNQPHAIRIAYERSGPETPSPQPGG